MASFERNIRRFLLGLFGLGLIAATVELTLLEHTEPGVQRIPLFAIAAAAVAALAAAVRPGRLVLRGFQLVGIGLIVVAGLGIYLHYQANAEFELEMDPALHGRELFTEALHGAMPALAPAIMVHLGLLALAYTYRHPALRRDDTDEERTP